MFCYLLEIIACNKFLHFLLINEIKNHLLFLIICRKKERERERERDDNYPLFVFYPGGNRISPGFMDFLLPILYQG